jgi:uncharacterized membrane protein YeaQ/YmgE (transglycosylase-associated protein family)
MEFYQLFTEFELNLFKSIILITSTIGAIVVVFIAYMIADIFINYKSKK